jgi:divalent metal cation (Fe/Co/Zn/Cd) transporter
MIKNPINDIIGIRTNDELKEKIVKEIKKFDDVNGVYDLLIHNYGPVNLMCSVHIEVNDNLTAREIHKLSKDIEMSLYNKYDIITTIGIYASNNTSKVAKKVKENILKITNKYETILQLHGLYIDEDKKIITFDLIYDFNEKDIEGTNKKIKQELKEIYPEYKVYIIIDKDY